MYETSHNPAWPQSRCTHGHQSINQSIRPPANHLIRPSPFSRLRSRTRVYKNADLFTLRYRNLRIIATVRIVCGQQGLCNGTVSVRLRFIRSPHSAAAGLLLWTRRTGDISINFRPTLSCSRAAAADAGRATLSADVGSRTTDLLLLFGGVAMHD